MADRHQDDTETIAATTATLGALAEEAAATCRAVTSNLEKVIHEASDKVAAATQSSGTTTPSTNGSFDQTVSGSILRANNSQSDMELVEITDTNFFTNNPDVVWAGWNRSITDVAPITFGIHHPAGDVQKVTRYDIVGQRLETNFNGNPNTQVWFFPDFGIGYGEPGASGSALYNEEGQIIGILSGGLASCSGTTSL